MGYRIIKTYIDREISEQKENRPEFQLMIDESKQGEFQNVIVYKLDRSLRLIEHSVVYTERLKKNGVTLVSATESIADTTEGKLMRSIYQAIRQIFKDYAGGKSKKQHEKQEVSRNI